MAHNQFFLVWEQEMSNLTASEVLLLNDSAVTQFREIKNYSSKVSRNVKKRLKPFLKLIWNYFVEFIDAEFLLEYIHPHLESNCETFTRIPQQQSK